MGRKAAGRIAVVCVMSIILSGLAGAVPGLAATPRVTLSRASGPPLTKVAIRGSGFGAHRGIDLYFDTTEVALITTSARGAFRRTISVPREAVPGKHWISAVQRAGGPAAQAPFQVRTNWSQFRAGPSHQGQSPLENVLSPSNVSGLQPIWTHASTNAVASSPAVANGVVYAGNEDGRLRAFNAWTGDPLWTVDENSELPNSPAVAGGIVYLIGRRLYALRASTGVEVWNIRPGAQASSPAVVGGTVYYASNDSRIYAVRATTGATRWSYLTGGAVITSPAVVDGVVYVASTDGQLYAINDSTGERIWSSAVSPGWSSPSVANGMVYIGSEDGTVSALNASTGAPMWSFATAGGVRSSPAVANGVVYVGSDDGKVYALDASSGAELWSFATGGVVRSSPAVANGVLYFASQDDKVYALDASSGAELWSYVTGGGVRSSPAVASGRMYIGSDDGRVYSFGLPGAARQVARPDPTTLRP